MPMVAREFGLVNLPCPQCLSELGSADGGSRRIGNRRGRCLLCNAFAATLRRQVFNLMRERDPVDYWKLHRQAEAALYAEVAQDWLREHPPAEELIAFEAESWEADAAGQASCPLPRLDASAAEFDAWIDAQQPVELTDEQIEQILAAG